MSAEAFLLACAIYAATGAVFGLWFLLSGLEGLLPAARGAHAFRALLLPGLTLLWPWVLWRWHVLRRAPARA